MKTKRKRLRMSFRAMYEREEALRMIWESFAKRLEKSHGKLMEECRRELESMKKIEIRIKKRDKLDRS